MEKLSFDISKSEHIALTGPSSGGKDLATILMARLLAPDSGQIVVAGKQIADLPEAATGRIWVTLDLMRSSLMPR